MNLPNKPRVLAATYNPVSKTKMISFLVDFPTVLLAELRTHRILTQGSLYEHSELVDFNLSANSARAIPSNKYLQKVLDNPFIPIWTKQQKGMSGEIDTDLNSILGKNESWVDNLVSSKSGWTLLDHYEDLLRMTAHKQNANRLLAPFAWTTCIISGTEWENFFELRCPKYESRGILYHSKKAWHAGLMEYVHKVRRETGKMIKQWTPNTEEQWQSINKSGAALEFQVIAEILYDLYQEADWKESKYHIPFEDEIDKMEYLGEDGMDGIYGYIKYKYPASEYSFPDKYELLLNKYKMLISASMCAKLSYNTQDNEDTLEKHLERANMLIEHKHQEPFSHQAIAMSKDDYMAFSETFLLKEEGNIVKETRYGKCYNLRGFISQRYILENY